MEMPSASLINEYQYSRETAEKKANAYLEATKAVRNKEKELTDTYILSKRSISAEKYKAKSSKLINDFSINKENILFSSQYAPMIMAELTKEEIAKLEKDEHIDEISLINTSKLINFGTDHSRETLNQVKVESLLGLTGDGVKVGMLEAEGHPAVDGIEFTEGEIQTIGSESNGQDHATIVSTIIAGNVNGYAPDSEIYNVYVDPEEYKDQYYYRQVYSEMETLISYGVKIINCSTGNDRTHQEPLYDDKEKWYDHITSYHNITFVVAAGNTGEFFRTIGIGAMGYNSITVGAYDDCQTISISDDRMFAFSNYENAYINQNEYGIEKPDIVLPGNYNADDSGTSYAAPILTGSLALLFELKPSLAAYPQAVKAIVLASCHRKVLPSSYDTDPPEAMEQGITEKQGAGVPDIWTMACIVCQGSYGIGFLEASDTTSEFNLYIPSYGADNMNVSLTWLREVVRNDEYGLVNTSCDVGEYVNLDLNVFRRGEATPVGTSAKTLSTTEMTYFELDDNNPDYIFEISKPVSETGVRYGYAFSTDNTYAVPVSRGGIYRYKNLETETYLTLNPTTNEVVLQDYLDSTTQRWINKLGSEKIMSAHNNLTGGISIGSQINNKNNKLILSNSPINFSRATSTAYGKYGVQRLYTYISSTSYAISNYQNQAVASSETVLTKSMHWIIERDFYRNGDANADGVLNIKDATKISRYLESSDTMNNVQMYLADADYNGVITEDDATRVQLVIIGHNIY